jgi:hypothetical protein
MRHKPYFALAILTLALSSACTRKVPTTQPRTIAPAIRATPGEKAGPASLYPDPARTPGFPNPDITQASISKNICNPKWSTESIRPPESYTNHLKAQQMKQWGLPGSPSDYEEDHFISLELGGNPKDPRNLWPEAYQPKPGAREKDQVEDYLHRQVCSGAMTLDEAQQAIVTDWYKVYQQTHP